MTPALKMTARIVFLGMTLILLSRCATTHPAGEKASYGVKDIKYLENIAKNDPDKAKRAEARLQLAKIHSSSKNPTRNYYQALKELETYISLEPASKNDEEIQDWLLLLRELERVSEDNRKATVKLNQMKESVEQLKDLDIRMEEKRKKVK